VWLDQNVKPHKEPGYAIVNISLKPVGGIPGDASSAQIDAMADLAERYSFDQLRVTHAQNIVLPHVAKRDLHAVWQALREAELADANLDLISDIIACPGLDYCSLANARSIPVAQKIARRFASLDRQRDLGELKLKISGCINACGHHHAGHIGILGVDRKGTENYQLLLGGSGAEDVSLGKITGPGFDEDGIVDAVERVTDKYVELREAGERFLDTYRRVGFDPFKEAIYG
jgi:sulfite reductase (NADPH) hemoprotein beta-component